MTVQLSSAASAPVVVWLRQDLRLDHNPAVTAAARSGRPILFLYVLDDETPGRWAMGGASRWWLHHSLARLQEAIAARKGALILRRGRAEAVVMGFLAETKAAHIVWSRMAEPFAIARDTAIKSAARAAGVEAESVNSQFLVEPWSLKPKGGDHFKVFSPFWRTAVAAGFPSAGSPAPAQLEAPTALPPSDELASWGLLPTKPDWSGGLRATWTPGEAGAKARFDRFISAALPGYKEARNRPDLPATSALSPHFHFGEISPAAALHAAEASDAPRDAVTKFVAELGWREFSSHLLFHSPTLPDANWRPAFDRFPWREDRPRLRQWQRGLTGYPIVDAGMRELWATGWMHNRARMIVASFLVKHCLIDWRAGQDWFWDTLVDADLASNAASWQWVAGSGADAAPYFRIFNPVTQGQTYDPDGAYVRRWVPELAKLPSAVIHAPWTAGALVLDAADVVLGKTYPLPIVDHARAREQALAAFGSIKAGSA